MHQGVCFAGLLLGEAPVHRQKHRAASNPVRHLHLGGQMTPSRTDRGQGSVLDLQLPGIGGMYLQQRLGVLFHQAFHLAGARHRVPLAQIATHREHQGIGLAGRFRQAERLVGAEAGAAAGGGEVVVGIEPLGLGGRCAAAGIGPLLRTLSLKQVMAEAADVTKTPSGQLGEFGVDLCC